MNETTEKLIQLNQKLLNAIASGDWDVYTELCDDSLTAFEPEARGHLIEGLPFHQFYFDNLSYRPTVNTTIASPHVRLIGDDVAVVCLVRLVQKMNSEGRAETYKFEETRVWQKLDGKWKHVHFHRSANE
jgi:calcium/calmodulin-dependent protein kinase (CaM kinase) II